MNNALIADRRLVDTDILIDFTRGHQHATDFIAETEKSFEVCFSIITYFEMLAGARNKREQQILAKLFKRFTILPVTESISWTALTWFMRYHLSHGIGFLDCLIAATADEHDMPLCTKNRKHFSIIPDITIEKPF